VSVAGTVSVDRVFRTIKVGIGDMNLDREMSRYLVVDEESIRHALRKIEDNDEGIVV
ncbi:uncharacterized protein METZ01_LOCUS337973, partial [marine metagenome]